MLLLHACIFLTISTDDVCSYDMPSHCCPTLVGRAIATVLTDQGIYEDVIQTSLLNNDKVLSDENFCQCTSTEVETRQSVEALRYIAKGFCSRFEPWIIVTLSPCRQ